MESVQLAGNPKDRARLDARRNSKSKLQTELANFFYLIRCAEGRRFPYTGHTAVIVMPTGAPLRGGVCQGTPIGGYLKGWITPLLKLSTMKKWIAIRRLEAI